ncbi:hypothetical protein NQZ68_002173 [Dissostichus eleginoides]|nr:hypothetical protein NQZ68_002173 [Dissostichus eleginoides]
MDIILYSELHTQQRNINEILVRDLTGESRARAERVREACGDSYLLPCGFTSVSAEEQMQLCFSELSQHQTHHFKHCSSLIDYSTSGPMAEVSGPAFLVLSLYPRQHEEHPWEN